MSFRNNITLLFLAVAIAIMPVNKASALDEYAPMWDVSEWINGSPGNVTNLTGKVVIVEFFQMACPGCNAFSIPLVKRWGKVFAREIASGKLLIVSIHTVFEAHERQNPSRLRAFLRQKGIKHPVGIDRHKAGHHVPETMKTYQTRGTPEMVFIGKAGNIRFRHFGSFDTNRAERLIRNLLQE
jgi:thiol-disulfide isomerase/thioredoxin